MICCLDCLVFGVYAFSWRSSPLRLLRPLCVDVDDDDDDNVGGGDDDGGGGGGIW